MANAVASGVSPGRRGHLCIYIADQSHVLVKTTDIFQYSVQFLVWDIVPLRPRREYSRAINTTSLMV